MTGMFEPLLTQFLLELKNHQGHRQSRRLQDPRANKRDVVNTELVSASFPRALQGPGFPVMALSFLNRDKLGLDYEPSVPAGTGHSD